MQKTVSQGFRLSPQQQHVWWAQRAEQSSAFVVEARIDIEGMLDRPRLARAVEEVVERYEILRTTFPLLPSLSIPVQAVEGSAAIDWREESLADRPGPEREAALGRLCGGLREIPFDLAKGPLLRATLVELDGEHHALLLSQPALAADGVSLDLLAAEIAAAYHGGRAAGEVLQYADLAEILQDWQGAPAEEPGPAYWRKQDLSALVRVKLGRAGLPDGRPFRPERVSHRIGRAPLATAASQLGTTVFPILLAGWHAVLHLSTGEEEIVIGTLFDGRTFAELESALGPLARYLPVGARSTADSTLDELSRDFSSTLAEVSRRQNFYSAEAAERLLAEQGASGWPFGFDYRRPRELPAPPGAPTFSIGGGHAGLDRFGLRLSILDDGRSLKADLFYDPALFRCGDAERLLARFSRVLDGLLTGLPVGEIGVLTEAEERQVREFNRTESAIPRDLCAHQLFEERARLAPHAPALIHAGRTWTYAELNARSDRLAHHLRASGLGPGALVGVCLGRSPELVQAVLGILKAGAAYVPLDPESPAGRLSWMVEDAGLSLLLTQEPLQPLFSGVAVRVLLLAEDRPPEGGGEASRQGEPRLPGPAGPADLAYVIYTSGSTGRPKGVMIPHRSLVNYLLWARQAYAAGEGAGAPVHSAIGFDLTVTSLLVPLAAGTAVTLLDERRSIEALVAALRDAADFSLVKLTPAHLDVLRRELRPEEYGGRARVLVIGGEALRAESVEPWREHAPRTRLVNEYGPTETTVGCCIYEIARDDAKAGPVAIGRPIANTRLYIVGLRLQPVPLGAPGELLIGGDGLARGYLGRPELTAERFIPDPFVREMGGRGGRLYRTGDLVRLGPEGDLEFLGRIDSQIKVRGFRIEPGEIETELAGYDGVREAAVLAAEDPNGGTFLVACVAGTAEAGALRRHLLERLPEYMVPSRFAFYETLPLTLNGKVDRKELARTWRERVGALTESAAGEAPRTWTEELLAGIFAELLGLPRVDRGESFFVLGGHSLLATQVISRVRKAFGVEVSLRAFFDAPTVAALAGKVEALRSEGEASQAPPIVPVPREGPLLLSFAQQRLWFVDQLKPGASQYNIPVALRAGGALRLAVLERCLGEIVRRHEVLRTVFAVLEGSPVQVIQPAAPFSLPMVDLSGLPERAREALAVTLAGAEAGRPFDLARGPLLRGVLLRLAEDDHIAALTMHHIVSDGWSMGILVREVMALYGAFLEEGPSPLPELPIQYADFAAWQRGWLDQQALEDLAESWRRRLAGAPPQLDLPGARPRPAALSPRGAVCRRHFSPPLLEQLRALGRRESVTLFMTLLAALQALLHSRTGATDLVVGTDVAGRDRREIEGLIGFFINQLPLRTDLAGDPTLRELLGRVRETALEAYAHQDLPFDYLVDALRVERSLQRSPIFQVKLMLQNTPQENLDLPGLTLGVVPSRMETAQLDLHWSFAERGEELWLTLTYSTDLYDETMIAGLLDEYEAWLHAFSDRPEAQLAGVAAELVQAGRARQAEVDTGLASAGLAKLRNRRRQAVELEEVG